MEECKKENQRSGKNDKICFQITNFIVVLSLSQIVFFNISLKEKNMKEDLKPQLSVPVRYGKKSKEAPKKLPENLTAVHLPLLKSPLRITDEET